MAAVCANRSRYIEERADLLTLAGLHDGQESLDGTFAIDATRPEHDLPPNDRRSERPLGGVVRWRDPVFVNEREEMLMMLGQGARHVADLSVALNPC